MADIAGRGAPPPPPPPPPTEFIRILSTRKLLRQSLGSFLSFPTLPALLLCAILLCTFRWAIFTAVFRSLSMVLESDPDLGEILFPVSPPETYPPLPPDTFSSTSRRSSSSSNSNSNSSLLYPVTPSKVVKIPVPPSGESPFFFTYPRETYSGPVQRTNLNRKEVITFLSVSYLVSVGYVLAVAAYIFIHSSALGVVYQSVLSTTYLERKPLVPLQLFVFGASNGINRLAFLKFMHWTIKDSIAQLLSTVFLISAVAMDDEILMFKLMINGRLMAFSPISLITPFGSNHSGPLSRFLLVWTCVDSLVSVVFTIAPWVELMEITDKRKDKDTVKEGCFLFGHMPRQAIFLKWGETVVCGSIGRWSMVRIGGRFFGGFVLAILEMYFMVVWLNFYLAVRFKEAELLGMSFGLRDFEDSLDILEEMS